MPRGSRVRGDGSLDVGRGLLIDGRDVRIRVTTPGGPGGQHANRTLSRVVASLDVAHASSIPSELRATLLERVGAHVSASSSTSRSQLANRHAALSTLADRIADALVEPTIRRDTAPTRSSVARRIDSKRRRSALKEGRRWRDDD